MLDSYVILEVGKIIEEATIDVYGYGIEQGDRYFFNKMIRVALPKLDDYFDHRLKVKHDLDAIANQNKRLTEELEKVKQDKGSNDADYLELSARNSYLEKEVKFYKDVLKHLINKEF